MAIVSNAPGEQIILADGKVIRRKTQIATAGELMSPPSSEGKLKSIQITDDAAGVRRGVWEFVESDISVPEGEAGQYPVIELLGGSREVPVQTHPKFANLSDEDVEKITAAADAKDPSLLPDNMSGDKLRLHELLRRQIRYFLAPSIVARVTEIESSLPNLNDLLKLGSASGLPSTPANSDWIMTGVSARSVADKYEVTREYTLISDGLNIADFLYS